MEPHCALKAAGHLFKNKGCYHHNANDRFGLNEFRQVGLLNVVELVVDDDLLGFFGTLGAEYHDALAVQQEGVHVSDADACS